MSALGAYAVLGGLVSLLGWAFDVTRLTDWFGSGISIQPNTTVAVAASGLALLMLAWGWRPLAAVLGALVALIGGSVWFQYVTGLDLGIDALLMFDRTWGRTGVVNPGRMGIPGSTSWLLIGTAMLLASTARVGSRARIAALALVLVSSSIATLSLVGYFYGAKPLFTVPTITAIAVQTSIFILALSLGIVAAVHERAPTRWLLADTAAGALARRSLPFVIVLPVVLGFLGVRSQESGTFDDALGSGLFVLILMAVFGGLMAWNISHVSSHESGLQENRERQTFLLTLSDTLRPLADPSEVQSEASRLLGEYLGVSRVSYVEARGSDAIFRAGYVRGAAPLEGRFPIRSFGEQLLGACRRGDPVAVNDMDEDTRFSPEEKESFRSRGIAAFCAAMLVKDGRWLGALAVQSAVPRTWKPAELELIHEVADRTWTATEWAMAEDALRESEARTRASEEALRRNQESLYNLVNRAPFGIYIVDSSFRIVQINAGSQDRAFRNVRPAVGRDFAEAMRILWPEPVATEAIAHFRHTLETGEPYYSKDYVHPRADIEGVESYEWETHRIVLPDGQFGVVCYYYDTTQLRQAEEELREAHRRKDEFLAILAHELRNPLAPVRNAAHYLTQRELPDPELRRPIEMIDRQVAQMARLIDDLLDMSRISRGIIDLQLERVVFEEIARAVVDAAESEIESRGHTLRFSWPATPIMLKADRHRLAQVFGNLIANAAKYTPAGGHIEFNARVENGTLEVSVRDNGIGIPTEKLSEIFELFAQVDRSLERQGGLGIGLTLARQLVELHHGTIEARSEGPGHGSAFVVRLPVAQAATPATSRGPETSAVEPRRILVVDDNQDSAESLALLLQTTGHSVRYATNGLAGLAAGATFFPEVAFLDIGMPKMNGYELARRIREEPWGRSVHLVALSGWGQEADRKRAAEAGFNVHVVKPASPAVLARVLREVGGEQHLTT